ncbi:MAG: PP2C family protein-serine/threonine phosphatase [Pirellulales bacterium]|jgi:sigma-B regulation protein RsbU (phosphoserine phosphatase)
MRILVGWDDLGEAETISLVLNVDENSAEVFTEPTAFTKALHKGGWDTILLALNFPNDDDAFDFFQKTRRSLPEAPVLGAWKSGEIVQLAKFISHGLRMNIPRDANGEYLFLLLYLIESAYTAVQSERSRYLADRLREEVDSVRRLQESVIPHNLPSPPGYRVAARYEPSQIRVVGDVPVVMAGGDYYDVFTLDEGGLVLLVGDASGHGVKACMSIMTMHTLMRMIRDRKYPNAVDFVTEVNRRLSDNDIVRDQGGFITLLYCMLDTNQHRIQWSSAGHPMPMLQNLATNEVTILGTEDAAGLPLGIDGDWTYELCNYEVPANHRLLLYTDGLDEAFPEGGDEDEQFGQAGIIKCLQESIHLTVEQALEKLFHDSHAATRGAGRADDTTIVLLERFA